MMNEILQIITDEDKKNALTDESIALILNIKREYVTEYRLLKNIPDSRERKKPYLYSDTKKILAKFRVISDRKLTKILNDLGYDVSRFVVSNTKKNILSTTNDSDRSNDIDSNKDIDRNNDIDKNDDVDGIEGIEENDLLSFKEIIGCNDSLKMHIDQARAAILYPPNGLHTLILGPSGVGKSQLAEAMHKFALESNRVTKDIPFIVFNCSDYADNPQLLMAQLFGYNKGSFTGADSSKAGLIEKADGGILFLDEVHRLPSEGQEILFYLLDKGKYRRLGETESMRKSKIMLIAATTENPKSSLLLTFRRRIPMVIELPPIKERPFYERFQIITYFFTEESFRINRPIKIKLDAIKALMFYDCPGNTGQIRSDIQVACARGFLNTLHSKSEIIYINLLYLPDHVKMGLLKVSKRGPEIDKYVDKDIMVYPDKRSSVATKRGRYILPNEIYQFIEDRFNQLKNQGLSKDNIYKIVGGQVEIELRRFARGTVSNTLVSKMELEEIVGKKIISAVENAIKIANRNFKYIRENFFYPFAIHLSATYDRFKLGKSFINPQLENVKIKYANEYLVAREMVYAINKDLEIELSDDEVGFVAMYLKAFSASEDKNKSRVAVIVLTHGHVAKGMADVANKLLGVNLAHGIEMDLDEKPEEALLRTIKLVKEVDEGKGCVILVDMGSLKTFGEIITKKTGIPTRIISRVDTLMVLEAVRRSIMPDTTMDNINNYLDVSKVSISCIQEVKNSYKLPKAIVTTCITGEGAATQMKKFIEEKMYFNKDEFKIIAIGALNEHGVDKQITNIKSKHNIVAFIGAIDPKVEGIPFITVEEIMSGEGLERLEKITGVYKKAKSRLDKVVTEDLILVNLDVNNKVELIDKMVSLLRYKGYVKDEFMLSVYKREAIGATWIEGGIAIPHGYTKHVTKPSITIATLKKPILWEKDLKINIIFLIALKEDSKDYMYDLYKVLKDQDIIYALKSAKSTLEIKTIILANTILTE